MRNKTFGQPWLEVDLIQMEVVKSSETVVLLIFFKLNRLKLDKELKISRNLSKT